MDNEGRGTMEKEYDVVIIGTGTAGRTFEEKLRQLMFLMRIVLRQTIPEFPVQFSPYLSWLRWELATLRIVTNIR